MSNELTIKLTVNADTTEKCIRNCCFKYGMASMVLKRNEYNGLQTALVTFGFKEGFQKAFFELEGRKLNGFELHPQTLEPKDTEPTILFFMVPAKTQTNLVKRICEEYGKVTYVKLTPVSSTMQSAVVKFSCHDAANDACMYLQGQILYGMEIIPRWAHVPPKQADVFRRKIRCHERSTLVFA